MGAPRQSIFNSSQLQEFMPRYKPVSLNINPLKQELTKLQRTKNCFEKKIRKIDDDLLDILKSKTILKRHKKLTNLDEAARDITDCHKTKVSRQEDLYKEKELILKTLQEIEQDIAKTTTKMMTQNYMKINSNNGSRRLGSEEVPSTTCMFHALVVLIFLFVFYLVWRRFNAPFRPLRLNPKVRGVQKNEAPSCDSTGR